MSMGMNAKVATSHADTNINRANTRGGQLGNTDWQCHHTFVGHHYQLPQIIVPARHEREDGDCADSGPTEGAQ